jgi:hypothetical protein
MPSVPISGLNQLSIITTDDYFPLVDSGSTTTFRASFGTLNSWSLASGSASSSLSSISSSYSKTSSFSTIAITSSYATRSFLSDTASYFNFSTSVPPFATSSLSASWATTSFNSTTASFAITASFSQRSRTSDSSSYLIYSGFPNGTASYALNAGSATSSSYAITSSFSNRSTTADTASFINTNNALLVKAWATCVFTASAPNNSIILSPGVNWNNLAVVNSYNVTSAVRTMGVPPKRTDPHGDAYDVYHGDGDGRHWLITLSSALPSTNYIVVGGIGGGTNVAWSSFTMFPLAPRTTTQFTLSRAQSSEDFDGGHDMSWLSFMVMSNP